MRAIFEQSVYGFEVAVSPGCGASFGTLDRARRCNEHTFLGPPQRDVAAGTEVDIAVGDIRSEYEPPEPTGLYGLYHFIV